MTQKPPEPVASHANLRFNHSFFRQNVLPRLILTSDLQEIGIILDVSASFSYSIFVSSSTIANPGRFTLITCDSFLSLILTSMLFYIKLCFIGRFIFLVI